MKKFSLILTTILCLSTINMAKADDGADVFLNSDSIVTQIDFRGRKVNSDNSTFLLIKVDDPSSLYKVKRALSHFNGVSVANGASKEQFDAELTAVDNINLDDIKLIDSDVGG